MYGRFEMLAPGWYQYCIRGTELSSLYSNTMLNGKVLFAIIQITLGVVISHFTYL